MLAMGASKPWPDALQAFAGTREMSAGTMIQYFAPLQAWLQQRNAGKPWAGRSTMIALTTFAFVAASYLAVEEAQVFDQRSEGIVREAAVGNGDKIAVGKYPTFGIEAKTASITAEN